MIKKLVIRPLALMVATWAFQNVTRRLQARRRRREVQPALTVLD